MLQRQTFQYFYDGAEPVSGMARERIHADSIYPQKDAGVVTSGGSGFGIMALIVGIDRGFITREQGVAQLNKIVNFLKLPTDFMAYGRIGGMAKPVKQSLSASLMMVVIWWKLPFFSRACFA